MRGLAPALAGLVLLTACGSGGAPAVEAQPGEPCGALPSADPAAVLPDGFPALADQVLYGPASQGRTRVVFGRVPGSSFEDLRDELVRRIEAAGATIESTDQEAVEAEAFFTGRFSGTVRVQVLCEGQLEVRYKLDG